MPGFVKDQLERIGHTLWQAGAGYALAQIPDWQSQAEGAAAVVIAGFFAWVKTTIAKRVGTRGTAALGGGL